MIVRILTEGQYQVGDELLEELNRIDNQLVEVVGQGDKEQFHRLFDQMLGLIRSQGVAVPSSDLVVSDTVVPPPDTTLQEAREHFVGEGLIPG